VALGSATLATAALDPTVVDTTDETGRASVTFTIPSGVSGAQLLTITGPGGTSVKYPIQVAAPDVKTHLTAWVDRLFSVKGADVGYTVRVTAAGSGVPVGTVTISDRGQVLTTLTLTAADRGTKKVTLPDLGRGIHVLTAVFSGAGFAESRSHPSVVLVLR